MPRRVSNIIVLFITLTTLVLFFEFVLSVTSSDKTNNFANKQEFRTKYVIRNSHGYRDKEYSYQKPHNIFRILVLGDSQTFGHGIKKLEDTWPKKLEVLMNHGLEDPRFEIISLAGEGWNTDKQLYELFKKGFKYNPDLILLAFYQNDVPIPYGFKCQSGDIRFFPKSKVITWGRNNSKIYHFIEFRINRLLEKLEHKPTYSQCINRRFDSRGWDMEEIYLDTIIMSSQIKNIHFMLTTIPLIYKLGKEYPLTKAHEKVKKYCKKKELTCLDLYDEGFKGFDHKTLLVSKTDQHLNEEGAIIVAKTLYTKLKPLKTYKHLSKFNGAFDLNELLDQKQLIKELDKKFKEIDERNNLIEINKENETLRVEKNNKIFQYVKTISKNLKPTVHKIKLDQNGNFVESEVKYSKKNNLTTYFETKIKKDETILINRSIQQNNLKILTGNKKYHFYKLEGKTPSIMPALKWYDPKIVEEQIFNPTPNMLGPKAEVTIFNAISSFNKEFFFTIKWGVYQKKLAEEIIRNKPSVTSIRAVNRIKLNQ